MTREGYFQTRPIIPQPELDKLARCMTNIVRWKLRPEYVYMYDEVYAVAARLSRVLDPILGSNFQFVPQELGAYFIPVGNDAKGFKPHRDFLRVPNGIGPNGLPRLVTAWIPLTDATTLNSCLYVLPGHLDPLFPDRAGQMELGDAAAFLQDIRALPAQAGSVICWNTSLLHWGSRSSDQAAGPRLSVAVYFQSREIPPTHSTAMDIPSPLPFSRRLYLVERQWLREEMNKTPPSTNEN
jgi:ectoine hydroxylase-related dioxygenase (phytanoyl-CoA dioxygenase family)